MFAIFGAAGYTYSNKMKGNWNDQFINPVKNIYLYSNKRSIIKDQSKS